MITVYYVQKGSSFEAMRELYVDREMARFPDRTLREISYLNSEEFNGREIKYQKFVSFENAFRALKNDSRIIVDNLRNLEMTSNELKALLFSRKDEIIQLRVLEPNFLLDPSESQTYAILDLAQDFERLGQDRAAQSKSKKIVESSNIPINNDDLKATEEESAWSLKAKPNDIFRPGSNKKSYLKLNEPHPEELRNNVIKDRIKGLTYKQIQAKYKVSGSFIADVVKENNIRIERKGQITYCQKFNVFEYRTPDYVLEDSFLDKAMKAFLFNQKKTSTAYNYQRELKPILVMLAADSPGGKLAEVEDLLKFDIVMNYKRMNEEKILVYKNIEALKRFLRHLHAIGIQFKNPIAFIKTKKVVIERTKRISKEDVAKLLTTAREMLDEARGKSREIQWTAHRDFLAIFLLASCGMRHRALLHMRKRDFIFNSQGSSKLRLISKSMEGYFEINISAEIAARIETYIEIFLNEDPPETFIFCATNRSDQKTLQPIHEGVSSRNLKHIYQRSGIKGDGKVKRVAHTLRVTFATQMYESGVDIHKIKEILNHSHVNQTYQYIDVSSYENVIEMSWLPKIDNNVPIS